MIGRFVTAIGVLLVIVPFVPLPRVFGPLEVSAEVRLVPPLEWLLGMFVFGSIGWLVARLLPRFPDSFEAGANQMDRRLPNGVFAALLGVGLAVVLVITSVVVFEHRPLLVDSVVQLFQAQIFAEGSLGAPAPHDESFIATQHMLVRNGRWFSQYPPGHAAVLSLGVMAGVAWLVPVMLSLVTAVLIYRFAAAAWDERTGRVALVLLLFAPFFWIMGASFMNHVTCLFFAALFLLSFHRWESGGSAVWALAAGLAIGSAGLARPLTAMAIAAVFAPIGLVHAIRWRRIPSIMLAAAGGLCAVGAYLAWNAATTGDALVPGYLELWGASHGVGFHNSPWGEAHTPWTGLRNELIDLSMLASLSFEWPIPALLPAGIYLAVTGGRDAWDRRMALGLLAIPAAYFFYWHRDAYLGPRFLYSGLLFLVPLTARGLLALSHLSGRRTDLRRATVTIVFLCLAYTGLYAAPNRVAAYASSLASMKVDLPGLARKANVDHGVVFVAVSWGNRLLARMRGAGVPASMAEVAYRGADHCEIEQLLDRAREQRWSPRRLSAALQRLERGRAEQVPLNGDPTLQLTPGRPLAEACRAELEHDLAGYGNWLPFLLANDPALAGPIVYVRDLRDLNSEFLARRPGDKGWLYRPSGFEPLDASTPELTPR